MKRITTFAAMVFFAAFTMVLTNCSKQETGEPNQNQKQDAVLSAEDISIMNKIVAFRDKVQYAKEKPGYKSGETMTTEEAIWNLETMFNVSFGFPDEQYAKTKTDSAVVQIAIDGNSEVSLDDVVAKYDEIIGLVTQYYYSSGFSQKGFLLLDLEQGEITNGQLEISLRAVTGEKEDNWEPFGLDDYWWYGIYKGDCDWNNAGTDAAEKIEVTVNNNKPLVSPPPGYAFIYSNYEQIYLFGYEYLDESGEYYIFYNENETGNFTWDEKCLEPTEMNFHFNGERTVIYQVLPDVLNKPQNWVFMVCDLQGKQDPKPDNPYIQTIHHRNYLMYAYRYLVPIGIIVPPIEL
jgi:hypothetical protein